MIQGKDGTLPQVFCSHDITLCKIDNFISFFISFFFFFPALRTRLFIKKKKNLFERGRCEPYWRCRSSRCVLSVKWHRCKFRSRGHLYSGGGALIDGQWLRCLAPFVVKPFRATLRCMWMRSICLYLLLHSLEECVLWPWHVQAGCMFPSRCTLTSAHELETRAPVISLSLALSLSCSRSLSWLAHRTHRTHWQQIPGRINARLNWINIIQTCSIPAGLS